MNSTAERTDTEWIDASALPAGSTFTRSMWLPEPNQLCRLTWVLLEAGVLPELVSRLGLNDGELFTPPGGGAGSHVPCVVLGEAVMVTTEPPVYRPAPRYQLSEVARLTRVFAKPRQEADLRAMREKAIREEMAEKQRQEHQRQLRVKAEEAAREEARKRNSLPWRLREMEKKFAELMGTDPPPA